VRARKGKRMGRVWAGGGGRRGEKVRGEDRVKGADTWFAFRV
jgi:hypothetical protein